MLVDFIFVCSSQKEEEKDELEPGKAVYYTWAESTGSRELCWKCGTYSGKLKSEEVLGYPRHTRDWCFLVSFAEGLCVIIFFHHFYI